MSQSNIGTNVADPAGTILVTTKAYSRRMDDEITIKPGDKIQVINNDEEFNDGWYIGRNLNTNYEGLFPRLFTNRYIEPNNEVGSPERHERVVSVKNTMKDIDNALAALRNSSLDMLSVEPTNSYSASDLNSYDLDDNDSNSLFTPGLEIEENEKPLTADTTTNTNIDTTVTKFNGNMNDIPNWTPSEVSSYFHSKGFEPQISSRFEAHGINGKRLLELQLSHLKKIEIDSFGARFEIFKIIDTLRIPMIRPTTPKNPIVSTTTPKPNALPITSESTGVFESPGKAPKPPSYPSPVQPRMSPALNGLSSMMASSPTLRHASQDYFKYPPISEEGGKPNGDIDSSSFNFPRSRSPVLSPQHLRSNSNSSYHSYGNGNSAHTRRDLSPYMSKANGTMVPNNGENNTDVTQTVQLRQKSHRKTESGGSFVDLFNRISMLSTNEDDLNGDNTLTNTYQPSGHSTRPSSAIYSTSHSRNISSSKNHHHSTSTNNNHPRTPSTSTFSHDHSRSPSKSNPAIFSSNAHSRTPSGVNNHYTSRHSSTLQGAHHNDSHLRTPSATYYNNNNSNRHSHVRTPSGTNFQGTHSRSASGVKSHVRHISQGNSEVKKSRRSSLLSFLSPSKKDDNYDLTKFDTYSNDRDNFSPSHKNISHSRRSSAAINSVRHQSFSNEDPANITSGTIVSNASKPKQPLQKRPTAESSKSKGKFGIQSSAKKQTSAFQEGIRTISVDNAIKNADCSGWMSKKGSGTMGVWKTRFFTLHHNRLSYFSNTNDGKERGLIDITGHKVVPIQDEDTSISIYAASIGRGKYFFKLVPPQPGFKKGLTFTQPRVHYFAVESKDEMRKWVAALIKANIELDDSTPIVCSYNMPTVSLSKAQNMLKTAKEELSKRDEDRALHEADEDEMMWEEQNKMNMMQAAGFI
ncbi:polar growth protein [Maudiozyma exigua]|uniref:Polar growth protein n=1 Tax=Maudiozyma exigua TaxID=34358 RepID=A0A9P7B3I3_MAUEX|nr:polar growth protein [Kazachstania exigua]